MKRYPFVNTPAFRYAFWGFLIGCLFPILGTLISIFVNQYPFSGATLVAVQRDQVLLWIIDLAPIILGLACFFAGRREEKIIKEKIVLERTVEERSVELQEVNRKLENEIEGQHAYKKQLEVAAEELQLITQVTRAISMEQEVDKLLPLITRLVGERFGFYHVGIFLVDETGKYAVLKAANSLEGRHMLERGHRLVIGESGIVGNVAATGISRVATELDADTLYFNNPDLPETRTGIALPLMIRQRIIGVMDAQSRENNSITAERSKSLSILADQIAVVIENSRSVSEVRLALSEAQAFSRHISSQAWEMIAREQQIGYLHTPVGETQLSEALDWDEAQQAMANGKMVVLSSDNGSKHEPALAIPLIIRGETIGVLDIRSVDPGRVWQEEEIHVIQAIADRVSLALENARLFEETTSRANRERTVSDITTHIRSISDPNEMLQTALAELKNALGAKEIQIRPYIPSPEQNVEELPLPDPEKPAESAEPA